MSIEGQGHFFTIYFLGFVCFMLYLDKISGERLQDHWSSGFIVELPGPSISLFSFQGSTCWQHRLVFVCPPNRRGGGHIVFGADPVGVGVGVASFPCVIF